MGINKYQKEYKVLADKLRVARMASGLGQGRVAAEIEKSQSYVSKVEAGKINIGAVELSQLAKVYKKPMEHFLS